MFNIAKVTPINLELDAELSSTSCLASDLVVLVAHHSKEISLEEEFEGMIQIARSDSRYLESFRRFNREYLDNQSNFMREKLIPNQKSSTLTVHPFKNAKSRGRPKSSTK